MFDKIKLISLLIIPPILFSFFFTGVDLELFYLLFVLPLYLAIIVKKIRVSSENQIKTVLASMLSIIICYDISFDGVIRELISILFFDGVNMTRDPGEHIILAIFSVVTMIIVPIFYSILKKFSRKQI